jgi:hypothetical protein
LWYAFGLAWFNIGKKLQNKRIKRDISPALKRIIIGHLFWDRDRRLEPPPPALSPTNPSASN